jgi:mono/diheme cytochrome c family protein
MMRLICAAVVALAAGPAWSEDAGQLVYQTNCAACHQATGQGIKGAFPPLAGSAVVKGAVKALAAVVVNGRGAMPRFGGQLSDSQIAAALTYIRHSWGNSASAVTPAAVAAARAP